MTTPISTFAHARSAFAWTDFARLMRDGVASAVVTACMSGDGIGADDIGVKNGRWERRFMGDRAMVMPTYTPSGAMVDLVAFRPDTPRSFWTLTGAGMLLGEESLDRAQHYGEPLTVHESPLDWLRAGCDGIVILDWKHYWPAYLGGLVALKFNDKTFGRRAEALLRNPIPVPPMLVPAI